MKIKKPTYIPLHEVPITPVVMQEKSGKKIEALILKHIHSKEKHMRFLAMSGTEIYFRRGACSDGFLLKIIKLTTSSDKILRGGAFEPLRTALTRKRTQSKSLSSGTKAFRYVNSLLSNLFDQLESKQIQTALKSKKELDIFLLDGLLFHLLNETAILAEKISERKKSKYTKQNDY